MRIRTIKVKIGKVWLTTWGIKMHDWCHLHTKTDQKVKKATIHRFTAIMEWNGESSWGTVGSSPSEDREPDDEKRPTTKTP